MHSAPKKSTSLWVSARNLLHSLCLNLNAAGIGGEATGRQILPLGVGTEDRHVLQQLREGASFFMVPIAAP